MDAAAFSGSGFSGASTIPCDPADIGSRFADQPASVSLAGLAPGTTYHYRFLASSTAGSDQGADRTFSTEIPELSLPDNRAYEQVSPVDKDSNGVTQADATVQNSYQVSPDGSRISYLSFNPFPGSVAPGASVLSTRGPTAWSSVNVIPPQSEGSTLCTFFLAVAANSNDLSKSILPDGYNQANNCGTDDPELVPGEPRGVGNLFIRDNLTAAYQLVSLNPVTGPPADAFLAAQTPSLSQVAFNEVAQLTPDAPAGVNNLYEWSGGSVKLVSVAPDGTPMGGGASIAGRALGSARHAISDDGSKLFFQGGDGNLYVRVGGSHTVQVDASQGSGPGGGGTFLFATADGSHVFFTDDAAAGITNDTVPGSSQNLYRYDLSTGALSDLTPAADVGVLGLSGAGDSGADVYFVATGDLVGGATAGQPNLYHWHGGATTFIGTLSGDYPNDCVWAFHFNACARVTPDGQHLAFNSDRNLTNIDTGGFTEVYLYAAGSGRLVCASCSPSGASPTGSAIIQNAPFLGPNQETRVFSRELSADGSRLFFTADGPLVGRDTNGQPDVYEYEGGKLHLISSGTATTYTRFLDASADGSDVFIETAQRLTSSDIDGSLDIYDARVNGGFPEPPAQTPCSGDACRGAGTPAPGLPVAATVSFNGPGNAARASAPTTGRARVLSRNVRGSRFVIRVQVPASGRVTVTGAAIKTVRRSLSKAGSYQIRVSLTSKERSRLRHKRKLKLGLRVGYAPASGSASSTSVSLTVKA